MQNKKTGNSSLIKSSIAMNIKIIVADESHAPVISTIGKLSFRDAFVDGEGTSPATGGMECYRN